MTCMTKKTGLTEIDANLAPVDYAPLLKEILSVVKKQSTLFEVEASHLRVNIDAVAGEVVRKLARSNFKGMLPFTFTKGTLFSTAVFADSEAFKELGTLVERIQEQLQHHLDDALTAKIAEASTSSYVKSLLREAASFKAGSATLLDYPFSVPVPLSKHHLHFRPKAVSDSGDRLRGHKLTITVKNINGFNDELVKGLCTTLETFCEDCTQPQIDAISNVLHRRMSDRTSSLGRLKTVVWKESLGRLQKEAKVRYLEYVEQTIRKSIEKQDDGLLSLRNLTQRLRKLEDFLLDKEGQRGDGYYQVSYGGFGVNYRDLFSRADGFDVLPIITEIEGSLGETFNKVDGEQVFTTGVKLKLNGPVQSYDSVFSYYLAVLDPTSSLHKERKTSPSYNNQPFVQRVLKVALLYYFVFKNMLHLSIDESIIDPDPQRMLTEKEFFWQDAVQDKGLNALKYIRIEQPSAGGSSLAMLPVTLAFEPMYYYTDAQEGARTFTMLYDIRSFDVLPVIFVPNDQQSVSLCQQYYQKYTRIVIPYQHKHPFKPDSQEAFAYRLTFLLLDYLCLRLLLDSVKPDLLEQRRRVFVPLVRIHLTQKSDSEKEQAASEDEGIKSTTKLLGHLLGEEHQYVANTQGFHISVLRNEQGASYKLQNGLASLYSVLPKAFQLDAPASLDKLAIIVVSSRKCDAHKDSAMSLSTIYGETLLLQRDTKGLVHVTLLNTFSANEDSNTMYRHPTAILEEAKKCYTRGCRHILYVAMAPYSSTLHVSSAETEEEQFFMSKGIIQALKDGKGDLNIYPIY